MRSGNRAASDASSSPSARACDGRKPWTSTSAPASRRSSRERSASSCRSRTTPFLERFQVAKPALDRVGSPPGGSTLMTSAPTSASRWVATGPAIPKERSTMRTPPRMPSAIVDPQGGQGAQRLTREDAALEAQVLGLVAVDAVGGDQPHRDPVEHVLAVAQPRLVPGRRVDARGAPAPPTAPPAGG